MNDLMKIKTYHSSVCEIKLNSVYSQCIYTKDRRDKFYET